MIIVGEKINATRKSIAAALEDKDDRLIIDVAVRQVDAGAHYLDVNGGDPREGREAENMAWLVELVQANTDVPVAVDSADPEAMKVGLSLAAAKPIMNSISLEESRLEPMLALAAEHDCMVVALLMSDGGTPAGVEDRLSIAETLIKKLASAGKKPDEIIIDPCFMPISTDSANGRNVIEAIAAIRRQWPEVHIGGGLSNISFGLPKRRFVNMAALCQAIHAGMDMAIVDPCAEGVMASIYAAEAVAGRDDFCMNYVTASREGKLG